MNKVTADTAIKLVAANNYISYNKVIAKKFGLEATIVFGELCSIANIYNDKEFYCRKEQIEEDTCLSEDAVRRAIRFLALCGAITITKKGVPCKNYYTINIQAVCDILNNDDWVKPVDEVEERKKQKRKEKRDKETQASKSSSNGDVTISSDSDVNTSSGVNVTTSRDGDVTTSSGDDVTTTFKKTIRETIKDNINLNYNSFSSSCDSDISQNTDTKKLSSQSNDYSDNFPEENQETEISHFVDLDIKNNKSDLSEHNESHLVDKENDNNEKIVISSQSHDYSEITPTTAADIPFPEDVKEKKIKKVSKKADTPSFPRQDYKDVMDLYYQTRNELSSRMNVTDVIFKPNQTNALLKDYFTKYGVEKCKLAIKNASKHTWILNKTDFSIYSVFNKSMFEKFLEDTSVVTNKKLRHQMFFNDPKHSHIDYENQDYKEGY